MSSDEEFRNNALEVSDNEQNNEILQIDDNLTDQEEQTEEVLKDETAEGEGGDEKDGDKTTVKPKRVIRNPRPKLNAETLKGPRGIAALESYFQHVKFKGKGKEQQDLDVIIKTYEYWCHRLFPKFPFDSCIERLESLGTKRAAQTHIKRIRFDLLIEDKPILSDSDEEPNVEGFVDIRNDEINQQQNHQFDQLLGSSAPTPIQTSAELTDEQLNRIRLNKERAERLKQERLKKIRDKAEESLQMSSQLPGTSGLQTETTLESSEAAGSTQSDSFSQEDCTSGLKRPKNKPGLLEELEDGDGLFDHESTVKGKMNVKGARIKKKSNRRPIGFDSDSDKSDDENTEDNIQNETNKAISSDTELLNIDHNSSDSGFVKKKKSKLNTIYDSDDDQNIEENQEDILGSESRKSLIADDSDEENFSKKNISHKKLPKHSTLVDTDDSDQEMEQVDQPSRETDITKKTLKDLENSNHSDQEMDTDQMFNDTNKANSLITADLNEHSSDLTSSGLTFNSLSAKINNIEMAEMDKLLHNDKSMEVIQSELEAVLKSTQDKNYIKCSKSMENKENSSEDNVI